MKEIDDVKMTPMQDVRKGNGVIYVSNDIIKVDDVTVLVMAVANGSTIGTHKNEDGETEVYQVINGGAPIINGVRTKASVCPPGESHYLENDTGDWITVLSIISR